MPPAESGTILRVVILGTDALLDARPATPIQLARACFEAGFDFVAPVSWGEELLAGRIIESVKQMAPPSSLIVHCPFVAEAVREQHDVLPMMWRAAAPPVVTARYVRAAFYPRPVHVTYVGRCPGATAPDVDACVLPQVLFGRLLESGIVPEEQPTYFEEMLPPDRSRYASVPGGIPDPGLLHDAAGARLREAAAATLHAVALAFESPEPVVIDLESASGCVCASDRFAASLLEPPRSTMPVVASDLHVDLAHYRSPPETIARPETISRAPETPPAPPDPVYTAGAADTAAGADLVGTMEPWVPWGLESPVADRPRDRAGELPAPAEPAAPADRSEVDPSRAKRVADESDDWWAEESGSDTIGRKLGSDTIDRSGTDIR